MASQLARLRLKKLKDVCCSGAHGGVLLLVAGQDAKFNAGSRDAIQYLFASTPELTSTGQPSYLDELFLFVSPNGVGLFCPDDSKLTALVSAWPDLAPRFLTSSDAADIERAEYYKVSLCVTAFRAVMFSF